LAAAANTNGGRQHSRTEYTALEAGKRQETDAMQAKVLTEDEARPVAANIAWLPELLGHREWRGEIWRDFRRSFEYGPASISPQRINVLTGETRSMPR
jgi:hypothetical protein